MESICVFTGSSPGRRSEYQKAAATLGEEIATRGLRLVYGGAAVGLMGLVADAALSAGGKVIGVIPRQLMDKEIAHKGLTELRVSSSMHERKALMAELADGFVALPGGYGTLEELMEVLTWSQLGLHRKPCGVLDVAGYFAPLLGFLDQAVHERFVRPEHRELILADVDPVRLLDRMESWSPPSVAKWIDRREIPEP
ncbi:MAG: TIGR00730 family Rossman fold protein [Acidimicrobiales bacterium]